MNKMVLQIKIAVPLQYLLQYRFFLIITPFINSGTAVLQNNMFFPHIEKKKKKRQMKIVIKKRKKFFF